MSQPPSQIFRPYSKMQLKQGADEKYLYFNDYSNSPIRNRLVNDHPNIWNDKAFEKTQQMPTGLQAFIKSPLKENLVIKYKQRVNKSQCSTRRKIPANPYSFQMNYFSQDEIKTGLKAELPKRFRNKGS